MQQIALWGFCSLNGTHSERQTGLKWLSFWGTEAIWSEGYFVSTVGVTDKLIRTYIENQGKKDTGQTLFEIS